MRAITSFLRLLNGVTRFTYCVGWRLALERSVRRTVSDALMNRLASFLAVVLLVTAAFACAAGENAIAAQSASSESARTAAQAKSNVAAVNAPLSEEQPEHAVGAAAATGAVPARTRFLSLEEAPEGGHWLMIVSALAIVAFIARRRSHSVHS